MAGDASDSEEGVGEEPNWPQLARTAAVPFVVMVTVWALVFGVAYLIGVYIFPVNRVAIYGAGMTVGPTLGAGVGRAVWKQKYKS